MTDTTTETTENLPNQSFEKKLKQSSATFFWPLLLIILGILFLLNNLELLPWSIWNNLWRFWPLLLVLFGLEILLGKGRLTNMVITLIGLILLLTILSIHIPQFEIWINQFAPQINFSHLTKLFSSYSK